LGAALAAVASGYLINRANAVEETSLEGIRAGHNHHLQLALAGALRTTLDELQPLHPSHKSLFDLWQAILEAALDQPTTLLEVIIPAEFTPLLDAASPHADRQAAAEEIESLLRFWLAYQEAYVRTKSYPSVPPSATPELPADLRQSLQTQFLPEFQRAFANLLVQNDSSYARRAFERRHLQQLVAASREQTAILESLNSQYLLPLAPLRPPDPLDERHELDLLRPQNRSIPIVGRQPELDDLQVWLTSPAPISVRVITGPAGAGKTRLAIQLLEGLDASNWHAGFLRESDLNNLEQRRWYRPTLAIIDYPASVAQQLKSWMAHLTDQTPNHRLRILLLEREASINTGWLGLLLDHTSTGHRIASLLDPPTPYPLAPLNDVQLRRQVLQNTLQLLGGKWELPPPGRNRLFDRRLGEPRWQYPLYLMMAALVARKPGGLPQALSLARTDLAFRLADRELSRIRKFLPPGVPTESARLLVHLAGIITACRSVERSDLVLIAKEESAELGIEFHGGPRVAAERIAEALNRQNKPAPIEPDIIGEAVLLRCFGGEGLKEGTLALVRAARRANCRYASNVCSAILRTSQDFANDECQDPLDWVEEFISTGEPNDLGLLLTLEGQMPQHTLVLRERAARLDQLLLTHFKRLRETAPSEQIQTTCAQLASNLSSRLAALGHVEAALAHIEEAVRSYRQLAPRRPDVLAELAACLDNRANIIGMTGRRDEALTAGEEALDLYRQLAQESPDPCLPGFAACLDNQALRLTSLGLRKAALTLGEEAVRIYRELVQRDTDAFLAELAGCLDNHACRLGDLGRRQEALAQSEEAVDLYQQLAQHRPDAFLPDLGAALTNLALRLSALSRREEALARAKEAVALYTQLAEQRPDAFQLDLAAAVNNLAKTLAELGRYKEALLRAQESADINRRLARRRPDASLPDLAMSLGNLAAVLKDLGRHKEALARAEEAVQIYRELAERNPDAFLSSLAISLNSLAPALGAVGRRKEALARAEEANDIYRQLARHSPEAFLPDLAMSLCNLAESFGTCGCYEEALARAEEAVGMYRQLEQQNPDAFLPRLAASLNNLAAALAGLGRREEALSQAEEAIRIQRQLAQGTPDAFLPDLALYLAVHGTIAAKERPAEAMESLAEAIRVITPFYSQRPEAHEQFIQSFCLQYMVAAQAANVAPDYALLAPLMADHVTLQSPELPDPTGVGGPA